MHTIHDQSYGTGLSPETTHKIDELKRLVYKYRQYQNNDPDEIVRWAINGAIYRPPPTMDDQIYGTTLSQSAIQRIQEFKVLMNKYPQYHTNPDAIIRLAIYNSINGDNTLLDDKLEQLRRLDSYNTWQQRHGIQNGIYNIGY